MSVDLGELQRMQRELNEAIKKLSTPKRPSARRTAEPEKPAKPAKKDKPAKPAKPRLSKFFPVDEHISSEEDMECVCSYHEEDPEKISAQSIKLAGKDELLIHWCPEHECAHYYLAQPKGAGFVVHELIRGAQVCKAKATPSGDMDTETALDAIEDMLDDGEEGDEDEEDDEDEEEE